MVTVKCSYGMVQLDVQLYSVNKIMQKIGDLYRISGVRLFPPGVNEPCSGKKCFSLIINTISDYGVTTEPCLIVEVLVKCCIHTLTI